MKKLFNSPEREKLEREQLEDLKTECLNIFREKSVIQTNKQHISHLINWSYLLNILSITTAGFFVVYLITDYAPGVKHFLLALLFIVAASMEYGKRQLITATAKAHNTPGKKIDNVIILSLACLLIASSTISYIGGNKLIVENATPPQQEASPKIDSLKNLVAQEKDLAESYQATTWKGRITRQANKGLLKAQDEQSRLNAMITKEDEAAGIVYASTLSKFNNKTVNFGIILGLLAIFSDFGLILMLFKVMEKRFEIARVSIGNERTPTLSYYTHSEDRRAAAIKHHKTPGGAITASYPTAENDGEAAPTFDGDNGSRYDGAPTAEPDGEGTAQPRRRPTAEENKAQPAGSLLTCPNEKCINGWKTYKKIPHNKTFCCAGCKKQYWEARNGRKLPNYKEVS